MANRIGGIIELKIDGEMFAAKGAFTYGYGYETRETILGSDGIHGFKSTPVAPFIEGEITDIGDVNIAALANVTDATITLQLGNGKIFVLRGAWSTNPDGITGSTDESNIGVRFEGKSAEEVR